MGHYAFCAKCKFSIWRCIVAERGRAEDANRRRLNWWLGESPITSIPTFDRSLTFRCAWFVVDMKYPRISQLATFQTESHQAVVLSN